MELLTDNNFGKEKLMKSNKALYFKSQLLLRLRQTKPSICIVYKFSNLHASQVVLPGQARVVIKEIPIALSISSYSK